MSEGNVAGQHTRPQDSTHGRRTANVFHLRDGKLTRLAAYVDAQRALADLGLGG
jgi:ketosteroid isomerase-like protein